MMQEETKSRDTNNASRILVSYFSGTGCTRLVAEEFGRTLENLSGNVEVRSISAKLTSFDFDHLLICFPVYASNAPKPILEWAGKLSAGHSRRCTVIAVSGGGNITPNKACRARLIRTLERKGYDVVNEDMVVMPSNWIVGTQAAVAAGLIAILPKKVDQIVRRLEEGQRHRVKPDVFNRCLSFFGRAETIGAKYFGERIGIGSQCSSCGKCARECPVGNITLKEGLPVFGSGCAMCLSCLYGCPEHALYPTVLKSVLISGGFNLDSMKQVQPVSPGRATRDATKGILWLGVRRYLEELQ